MEKRLTKLSLRFSLRTLLIVVTAIALLLHFWILPSERQRRFCAQLTQCQGQWWFDGVDILDKRKPAWYEHYFYSVKKIYVNHSVENVEYVKANLTKLDWGAVPKLNYLYSGWCSGGNGNDLLESPTLPNSIKEMYLDSGLVNNETAKLISRFSNLEALTIHAGRFNDDGLIEIAKLKKLKRLKFMCLGRVNPPKEEEITDRGLSGIVDLENLESFDINGITISDSIMYRIAKLSKLRELNVQNGYMTKQGFASLCEIENLESLWMVSGKLTLDDDDLMGLAKLKKLKMVHLYSKPFSDQALKKLQEELPNLKIVAEPKL